MRVDQKTLFSIVDGFALLNNDLQSVMAQQGTYLDTSRNSPWAWDSANPKKQDEICGASTAASHAAASAAKLARTMTSVAFHSHKDDLMPPVENDRKKPDTYVPRFFFVHWLPIDQRNEARSTTMPPKASPSIWILMILPMYSILRVSERQPRTPFDILAQLGEKHVV
eukprot:5351555-Amphidinium_carterae.4